jgi:hypothetical protein
MPTLVSVCLYPLLCPLLTRRLDNSIYQSNGRCHDTCIANYAFAVVQGDNCWCSNYVPSNQQSVSKCNEACPGYPAESCGSSGGLFGYIALNIKPSGTAGASSSSAKSSSVSSDTSPILVPAPLPSSSSSSFRSTSSLFAAVVISVSFPSQAVFGFCNCIARYIYVLFLFCCHVLLSRPRGFVPRALIPVPRLFKLLLAFICLAVLTFCLADKLRRTDIFFFCFSLFYPRDENHCKACGCGNDGHGRKFFVYYSCICTGHALSLHTPHLVEPLLTAIYANLRI